MRYSHDWGIMLVPLLRRGRSARKKDSSLSAPVVVAVAHVVAVTVAVRYRHDWDIMLVSLLGHGRSARCSSAALVVAAAHAVAVTVAVRCSHDYSYRHELGIMIVLSCW